MNFWLYEHFCRGLDSCRSEQKFVGKERWLTFEINKCLLRNKIKIGHKYLSDKNDVHDVDE
jgi:hypothetical protein